MNGVRSKGIFTTLRAVMLWLVVTPAAGQAQKQPSATAGSYLDRGVASVAKGELDRAIADFDAAIAFDPSLAVPTTIAAAPAT